MKSTTSIQKANWLSRQIKTYEENFFGMMPIIMIEQSDLRSIVALYILKNNQFDFLIIATILTMETNSAFLVHIKHKSVIVTLRISIIVNILLTILCFFFHINNILKIKT